MNKKRIDELLSLLNKIKSSTNLEESDKKKILSTEEYLAKPLILFYACEGYFDSLGGRLANSAQSYLGTIENPTKDRLLELLLPDALEAAVELGLYNAAKHLAFEEDSQPPSKGELYLRLSPEVLAQVYGKEKYNLIEFLEKKVKKLSKSNEAIYKKKTEEQQKPSKPAVKDFEIVEYAGYHNITIPDKEPGNQEHRSSEVEEEKKREDRIGGNLEGREQENKPKKKIEGLINYYLAHGNEEAAVEALKNEKEIPKDETLLLAIYADYLNYAVEFTNKKIPLGDKASPIFSLLFQKISKYIDSELGNLDIYLYIIKSYIPFTEISHAMEFAEAVELIIASEEIMKHLSKLLNPIKFIVHLIELTIEFKGRFDKTVMRFEPIKDSLTELGLSIFGEVKSKEHARSLLLDEDLESRDTIGIILKYSLIPFLNNPTAEEIARDVWKGPYAPEMNPLFPTSNIWEIVSTTKLYDEEDVEETLREKPFEREKSKDRTHQFEFSVWNNSASLNFFLLAFEYIAFAGMIFVMEFLINKKYNDMRDYNETYGKYYEATEGARDIIFYWFVIALLILISSGRFITYTLFHYFTRRTNESTISQFVINFFLFLTLLVMFLPRIGGDTLGIGTKDVEGKKLEKLAEATKNNQYISIFSAIAEFCLGLRIAFLLKYTDTLGPLVTIIGSMLGKAVRFGIIYIVMLFAFSLSASLLFENDDKGFEEFGKIIFTMFQASQGGFEMNPDKGYKVQSKLFYVVFVFVINIVLLNFVIAIVTDTYSAVVNKSSAMVYQGIILLREQYEPHDEYQFLVASCLIFDVPLSLIYLPIFPLLNPDQKRAFNKGILYIEYTCWFIIIIAVYVVAELLLLPICYIIVVAKKFRLFIKNRDQDSFAKKLGETLLYLVFGIFILLFYILVDTHHFIHHAYTHKPEEKRKERGYEHVPLGRLEEIKNVINYPDASKPESKEASNAQNARKPQIEREIYVRGANESGSKKESNAPDANKSEPKSVIDKVREKVFSQEEYEKGKDVQDFIMRAGQFSTFYQYITKVLKSNKDAIEDLKIFFQRFYRFKKLTVSLRNGGPADYDKYSKDQKVLVTTMKTYDGNVYKDGIEKFCKSDTMSQCLEVLKEVSSNIKALAEKPQNQGNLFTFINVLFHFLNKSNCIYSALYYSLSSRHSLNYIAYIHCGGY
eukprot:TRINITY_DN517_c0_g1_i5.p2 TRINITY_DN517_c0_g1~~TRINITY_DN517_c0_g1_i5.p2  ORF type:complete len:1178 (+),score=141.11 TRINITY_DN517_c0_g1_i5:208-3741(+)